MRRRQLQSRSSAGGDWFGRCGGWHAAAIPALEPRQLYVGASWGKIVICAMCDGADPVCLVMTRETAAKLQADLQMALAQ